MAGELITKDVQIELRDLLMGADTDFGIRELTGLDMPELRTGDRPRPQDHGLIGGNDYYGRRVITVRIEVTGSTAKGILDNLDTLAKAWSPSHSDIPLVIQWATYKRRIVGRPRRRAFGLSGRARRGAAATMLQFECPDPRIYDDAEQTGGTGVGSSSGGLAFPHGFPHAFGTASPAQIIANNAGNFPTRPFAKITGPITNPKLEHVGRGEFLELSAGGGLVLGTGDFVEIDFDKRTVLLGGTASRYSKLSSTSKWFELDAGDNQINFSGATIGSPTLELRWRSAWT